MCGHFGVAGWLESKHVDSFSDGLIMTSVRGIHGTGVASVSKNGKPEDAIDVFKRPVHVYDFKELNGYSKLVNAGKRVLLGHNRHATRGSHTVGNSHPFAFQNLVGAHNGTLDYAAQTRLEKGLRDRYGTDSETLFAHLEVHGVGDTVKLLSGAWALVWYDQAQNTMNFLRNGQRTLFVGFSEDRKIMMWGSEPYIIRAAFDRNRVKIGELKFLTEDIHYSWEVPKNDKELFAEEPAREKREGFDEPAPFWEGHHGHQGVYQSGRSVAQSNVPSPSSSTPANVSATSLKKPGETEDDYQNFLKTLETFRDLDDGKGILDLKRARKMQHKSPIGPNGVVLWKQDFDKRTTCGCSWCGDPVYFGENVKFLDQTEFLCSICISDPEPYEAYNAKKETVVVA